MTGFPPFPSSSSSSSSTTWHHRRPYSCARNFHWIEFQPTNWHGQFSPIYSFVMHNFRSNFPSSSSFPSLSHSLFCHTHIFSVSFASLFVSCVPFVAITMFISVIDYKLSHLSACLTRANISAFNENKSQLGFVCISCVSKPGCFFFSAFVCKWKSVKGIYFEKFAFPSSFAAFFPI